MCKTDTINVGDFDWMRSDYTCNVTVAGVVYPSVEHAFQGAKVLDPSAKVRIANARTAKEAKKINREYPLLKNWDEDRGVIMDLLQTRKFLGNPLLGERLAKTGSAEIVMEGPDNYWGSGKDGLGANMLGAILEDVRRKAQLEFGINPADYSKSEPDEDEYEDEEEEDDYPDEEEEYCDCDYCSGCGGDEDEEEPPSLKEALLYIVNPEEENCLDEGTAALIDACNDLYNGAEGLMPLIKVNDFDAALISRRLGIPEAIAEDAISKLRLFVTSLNKIKDLLASEDEN